jgi:hypothetical protein
MAQPLLSLAFAAPPEPAKDEDPRVRALERLYQRRESVDRLIQLLEAYERSGAGRRAPCVPINETRKRS